MMARLTSLAFFFAGVLLAPQVLGRSTPRRWDRENGDHRHIPVSARPAKDVIARLGLIPNPEKGYFTETFRDPDTINNRSVSTAIYYLLEGSAGSSVWHRVDAVEVWHYYAGAPLTLSLWPGEGEPVRDVTLGPDIFRDQQPQVPIAKWEWQSARSHGDWTLVGTTGTQIEFHPVPFRRLAC